MGAYQITLYGNDENIEVSGYQWEYGDNWVEYDENIYGTDIEDGYPVTFKCDAKEGYEFYRWVYRVGSTNATKQYSYDNPFYYDECEDIYIRAEAIRYGWLLYDAGISNINASLNKAYTLDEKIICCLTLSFLKECKIVITSSSNNDTIAYFSTTNDDFDEDEGIPYEYDIISDDADGSNQFKIETTVEAGTDYYLWFRFYNGEKTGDIRVNIEVLDGWREVVPYIYDGSSWREVVPYIYDGSSWVEMSSHIFDGL